MVQNAFLFIYRNDKGAKEILWPGRRNIKTICFEFLNTSKRANNKHQQHLTDIYYFGGVLLHVCGVGRVNSFQLK